MTMNYRHQSTINPVIDIPLMVRTILLNINTGMNEVKWKLPMIPSHSALNTL